MYSNRNLKKIIARQKDTEEGYTLIEVLVTMVILGMILLVVNLVLMSMIRVSYNTDVRIKMRQGIEFAFEVMRRNVKSTDPGTLMKTTAGQDEALQFFIPGAESEDVLFYLAEETMENGDKRGALKALWVGTESGDVREVFLTSPYEIDVKSFKVDVADSVEGGSTEVVLTITADSMHKKNSQEPLIQDLFYQTSIIARYREI